MASSLSLSLLLVSFSLLYVSALNMQGSYLSKCQALAGLPAGYRMRERVEVNDNKYYWISSIFSNTDCSGQSILRYDRIMTGTVGALINASLWKGSGAFGYKNPTYHMTYQHMKKLLTPLNAEGAAFASALCPSATFHVMTTTDVMDITCPGFIYPCAAQGYKEESCVYMNSDGDFMNCQRNSSSGSCTVSTMIYNYYSTGSAPYMIPPDPSAFTFSDLAGLWEIECVPLYGLPTGWRISELSFWNANGEIQLLNYIFSDSKCANSAFNYARTLQGYLGEESVPSDVFSPGSRLRELATQYTSKYINHPSSAGVDYLNSLCPQAGWQVGVSKDIMTLDCLPFIASCNTGAHYEYIQAGLTQDNNLIRYSINPVNASCSVAAYSTFPFMESINPPVPYVVMNSDGSRGQEISLFLFAALLLSYFVM